MDKLPLHNMRVVITRPQVHAEALGLRLQALGAVPVVFPVIRIVPAANTSPLDEVLRQLATYDWIIFTSVNGVDVFLRRFRELEGTLGDLQSVQVAAVGSQTARALEEQEIKPSFVPTVYTAEHIVEGLGDVEGQRIGLPRGNLARKSIPHLLRKRGATVDDIMVYQTVRGTPGEPAWDVLREGFEAILFTSGSTVRHFMALADDVVKEMLDQAVVGCIGPVTARTAGKAGLTVHVVPDEYTTPALVDALGAYCSKMKA